MCGFPLQKAQVLLCLHPLDERKKRAGLSVSQHPVFIPAPSVDFDDIEQLGDAAPLQRDMCIASFRHALDSACDADMRLVGDRANPSYS